MLLAKLAFLALIIERLVESLLGVPFDKFEKLSPYKWALMYVALVLGLVAAFTFELDLLAEIGVQSSTFGVVLTGLAVGGGSNLLHDIIAGLKK